MLICLVWFVCERQLTKVDYGLLLDYIDYIDYYIELFDYILHLWKNDNFDFLQVVSWFSLDMFLNQPRISTRSVFHVGTCLAAHSKKTFPTCFHFCLCNPLSQKRPRHAVSQWSCNWSANQRCCCWVAHLALPFLWTRPLCPIQMLVELDVLGGAWHFLAMLHSSPLIFSHPKHPNPLSRYKFDRHQVYHVCHVLLLHRIFQCTLRFRRCAIVTYHLQWQCLHSEELIRHLVRMQGWTAKSCAVKAFCSWFPREIYRKRTRFSLPSFKIQKTHPRGHGCCLRR